MLWVTLIKKSEELNYGINIIMSGWMGQGPDSGTVLEDLGRLAALELDFDVFVYSRPFNWYETENYEVRSKKNVTGILVLSTP